MRIVSVAEMRQLEADIFASGMSEDALMAIAGRNAATELHRFWTALPSRCRRRLVILAGHGNNGGDGLVIARIAREEWGIPVVVHHVSSRSAMPEPPEFQPGDVIVDALLGTGARGAPRPPYAALISAIHAAGLPVVSIDLPSGLDGDTGGVQDCAVTADLTIAIGMIKTGLLQNAGPAHTGRLAVVPLPFVPGSIAALGPGARAVTAAGPWRRLPNDAHKNQRPRVMLVGGSAAYPGAIWLSARAAQAGGASMVRVLLPAGTPLYGAIPHSLMVNFAPGQGFFTPEALPQLLAGAAAGDVTAIGPGIGRNALTADFLHAALELPQPLILDADALTLLADAAGEIAARTAPTILTPHPGEAARLAAGSGISGLLPREKLATALAEKFNALVVLKGCRSIIATPNGDYAVNISGSASLATAGSGDALTGLIAALLPAGDPPVKAVEHAVFLHGAAGERGAQSMGLRGFTADELPEFIRRVCRENSALY